MTKKDVQTGRIVYIDVNDVEELTPERFYNYVDEGFCPIVRTVKEDDTVEYDFASHQIVVEGETTTYILKCGESQYTSDDLKTPYASGE